MAGDEWIECRLADACSSIDYGLTASAVDHEVGPRFLRITDIVAGYIDWSTVPYVAADAPTFAKYRLNDGDIVLARTGASTGSSSYVKSPPPAVFASYLVRLKSKPEFDARFLAYYLKSEQFWTFIRGVLGDKSAQPNASAWTMTQAPLRVPNSKDTQSAIARILGALDDKIELNRRMNETLEAIARALFKSWFVDLGPVSGVESDSSHPWRMGKLSELTVYSRNGIDPGRSPAEWFDHYSIPAFDSGRLPNIDLGDSIKSGKLIVPSDAVLLSKLNPEIPRIWMPCIGTERQSICSTEFIVLQPSSRCTREYLYAMVSSSSYLEEFESLVTGATNSHQRVRADDALSIPILIPDNGPIQRFTSVVAPIFKRIASNRRESLSLTALRDALLPRLISGELRVKDAEQFLAGSPA